MSTKLREEEEREMLLKLTRSTLGALNFSLRVTTSLGERGGRESFSSSILDLKIFKNGE
jgi:hypothetical protein